MTQIQSKIRTIAIIILVFSGWRMLTFPIPRDFMIFESLWIFMMVVIPLIIIVVGIASGIFLLRRKKVGLQLSLGYLFYLLFGEIILFLTRLNDIIIINYGLSLIFIIGIIFVLKILLSADSFKAFDISISKRKSLSYSIGLISFVLILVVSSVVYFPFYFF